jgi:hypothetical protein
MLMKTVSDELQLTGGVAAASRQISAQFGAQQQRFAMNCALISREAGATPHVSSAYQGPFPSAHELHLFTLVPVTKSGIGQI